MKVAEIEKFVKECLPEFSEDEGFVAILMCRRKWLLAHTPEKEPEFREAFPSNEVLISRAVLKGDKDTMMYKLKHLVQFLSPEVGYFTRSKGRKINVADLYREHPEGFSLMSTYEPRNLVKAGKQFLYKTIGKLLHKNEPDYRLYQNLDKEWISYVHKTRRVRGEDKPAFVLLDFDNRSRVLKEADVVNIRAYLADKKLLDNVSYACTSPSNGVHVILSIDSYVGKTLFAKQHEIIKEIREITEGRLELEIKTDQCLTHIPGVNPHVRRLDIFVL